MLIAYLKQITFADRDMITRVLTSVTKETSALNTKGISVSLIKLQTNGTQTGVRESIRNTLMSISIETVGRNFVAVVGMDIVEILMEYAKDSGLVNIKNQWLYVISDANAVKSDVSHLKKLLKEGDNVAFIYNTTSFDSSCAVIMRLVNACYFILRKKTTFNFVERFKMSRRRNAIVFQ